MNLILCAYNKVGRKVLERVVKEIQPDSLAVFTHETDNPEMDVQALAKELGVWCSTESINKTELPFKPDIISSVYYRYIIKQHVIDACDGKIFNAHPSLLPNHRGCSAIPWAIIDDDRVTGVTFHYIDPGIDTGNIILQSSIQIDEYYETQESLYEKCMDRVYDFWPGAFELVKSGFKGAPQIGDFTQYHKRGVPYNGELSIHWDYERKDRFIRAMTYPPLPGATIDGVEVNSMDDYFEHIRTFKRKVGLP